MVKTAWWKPSVFASLLAAVDCLAVFLSFLIIYFLRRALGDALPEFNQVVPVEPYVETSWMLLLWPAVFYYDGLYDRGLGTWDEYIRLAKGACFGGMLAVGATFTLHAGQEYSRAILIGTCIAAALLVPLLRAYFKSRVLHRLLPVRVILLSDQDVTSSQEITQLSKLGYEICAVPSIARDCSEDKLRDQILAAAAGGGAEEIIIDSRSLNEDTFRRFLRAAERIGARVKVVPAFSVFQLRANVRNLDGMLLFDMNSGLARPFDRFLKRAVDVVGALLLLVILSPLLLAIAVLIMLTSPGPVFFRHMRLDYRGQEFGCWKFRTMHRDSEKQLRQWMAEDGERAREFMRDFKLKDDPRVTSVGRVLRRSSLDELPQLWNVLCGEMSLVGPRPVVMAEAAKYGGDLQYLRMAKGGMTGFWQVSGRNDVDYSTRIALDSYYVRNWSIWADLVILVRTVAVVLKKTGAY
jgi:undecaprenyl-phosphate galactose phosphotransferase